MQSAELNRLSSASLSKNEKDFLTVHFINNRIVQMIDSHCQGKLLDIGCGNKPYESIMNKKVTEYVGCDIEQSSLHKVDIICDALKLPFKDEEFDSAFTTQVIEHVKNPEKMVQEIFRVLKPGGIVIITGPFVWELHEEPHDYFRFTKYGFNELLITNKFEVISIESCGGKWAALAQIFLNIVYSTFKKKWLSKFLKLFFIHLKFTYLLNSFALWIDNRYKDDILTLNYAVIARKK